MAAIYIHIPFCKRMCGYCDFFKSVKLQYLPQVLDEIERELVDQRDFIGDKSIQTIYFGGGTPSLVSVDRIKRLLDVVAENYDLSDLREVTLEMNPDDVTLEYLSALREAGVNRLSIGIQSFNDEELKLMNRRHSANQAIEAVRLAQSVGFDNITIDLIFGVAGFGGDLLQQSIQKALSLGVQHISAYHLTIESGTAFARNVEKGAMQIVAEEISQSEYDMMESMLVSAGYEHYEVSNYALPGFRSQHNSSYWKGVQYLGVGPAAHSFNGDKRRYSSSSIEEYLSGGDERYHIEELSEVDHYNELIMTSLRCCEGVSVKQVESNFSSEIYQFMVANSQRWLLSGELREEGGQLFIPTEHFLISDSIIESLFFSDN